MSDTPPKRTLLFSLWTLAVLLAIANLVQLFSRQVEKRAAETRLASEVKEHALVSQLVADARQELAELQKATTAREAEFAERAEVLRRREAAIGGREDAASERTQSSFQGLLIQQRLTQNLEALKASLPDMSPEVEKLAREHAQLSAERERLEKENAVLRQQRLGESVPRTQ